jgi:5-methylcytosine-specific restriction endonuclease McrA
LAPGRYKVQFTAGAELRDKLDRLRALMRSSVPDGDLAAIIDAAVTEKLERLEARRFGRTKAPRKASPVAQEPPSSRHVPAAVRRAVYERDGGRCRYVDDQGRRCSAREGLEFHHRHPFALGGRHSVDEMGLLCRTHNGLLAELDFGRVTVARHRRSDAVSRTPTVKPQAPSSP